MSQLSLQRAETTARDGAPERLLLAEEHPDWLVAKVDAEARRLVYGVALEE